MLCLKRMIIRSAHVESRLLCLKKKHEYYYCLLRVLILVGLLDRVFTLFLAGHYCIMLLLGYYYTMLQVIMEDINKYYKIAASIANARRTMVEFALLCLLTYLLAYLLACLFVVLQKILQYIYIYILCIYNESPNATASHTYIHTYYLYTS